MIVDDVNKRAQAGDKLAQELAANWEYPLEMMFLTPDGKPVSKLNSFKDFPGMHPDVSAPPGTKHAAKTDGQSHSTAFLNHLAAHFGK